MTKSTQLLKQRAQALQAPTQAKKQPRTIKDLIRAYEGEIAKALPAVMTPERFVRIALSAVSATPKLMECTQESLLGALLNSAQLGLEPNTPLGQAYLIPYNNKKEGTVECQFQIGYKGLLDLAYRTGDYQFIRAEAVHEGDEFSYSLGLDAELVHKPVFKNRGETYAYYAVYKLNNGGYNFVVMSREDVEQHKKKYSKAYNSPWNSDFDAMAKKTVLKQLLKYAPLKTDVARAVAEDSTIKSFDGTETDMSVVHDEYYDVEAVEVQDDGYSVDKETGEILMDGMTSAEVDAMLAQEGEGE